MAAGSHGPPLYIAVLLVLGVNRFFLSSLSAALPHVVAGDKLVMANSVSPTVGGVMATIGGIVALGLNVGHRQHRARRRASPCWPGAAATWRPAWSRPPCGATCSGRCVSPAQPPPGRLLSELAAVAAGLAAGARYVIRRRGPAAALGATGGYSFLFGPLFLMVDPAVPGLLLPLERRHGRGHLGSAGGRVGDRLLLRRAGHPAGDQAAVQAGLDHAAAGARARC